jgi:hypothetical protein
VEDIYRWVCGCCGSSITALVIILGVRFEGAISNALAQSMSRFAHVVHRCGG